MKPFSKRLNTFIEEWFEQNKDKFTLYSESQFDFEDVDSTFKRFTDHYREFKTVPMWYDSNEDNIFADTTVNAKFRAWHDYSHILVDADFSLAGELKTYLYQQSLFECVNCGFTMNADDQACINILQRGQSLMEANVGQ